MNHIGVDGCKSGWFWVTLTHPRKWEAGIEPKFNQVWNRWRQAESILVDIPIGLRDSGYEERLCDREARKALGRPRRSSVFPVPCRAALYAEGYRGACDINERHTGRRLSRQTWNIAGKIREVDDLLRSRPPARGVVQEIHPEVLFWALNGGKSMKSNKRTDAGFKERVQLLELRYPGSQAIVASVLNEFARKDVERDDILDALAAAATGKLSRGALRSLPEHPDRDSTGLPMQIVYWRP